MQGGRVRYGAVGAAGEERGPPAGAPAPGVPAGGVPVGGVEPLGGPPLGGAGKAPPVATIDPGLPFGLALELPLLEHPASPTVATIVAATEPRPILRHDVLSMMIASSTSDVP